MQRWKHQLSIWNQYVQLRVGGGSFDEAFWKTMLPTSSDEDMKLFHEALRNGNTFSSKIRQTLTDTLLNQSFFVTEGGYIGICPPTTIVGDEAWVLFGGNYPFILRERNSTSAHGLTPLSGHVFIGDAYVQGIMDGEFLMDYEGDVSKVIIF
jgi:hypothetical protein